MKLSFVDLLCCPSCKSTLRLLAEDGTNHRNEVDSGTLSCDSCGAQYPIINGIPHFVPDSNYADSFGFEWNIYGRVQIDSFAGNSISSDRFEAATGWSVGSKKGKLILDAGCGGGRFSEIALSTGATVAAFDYSGCIDFTRENFKGRDESLHLAQASILNIPFNAVFDAVYCMGVLQHTPDPHKTLRCLYDVVKPGGELVVDVYEFIERPFMLRWRPYVTPYRLLWRPLFKRLPHGVLHRFVRFYVKHFLALDTKVLERIQCGDVTGQLLNIVRKCLPQIANHSLEFPFLTDEYKRLWAEMNTFDSLSPKYDKPQTRTTMWRWAEELGLESIDVFEKPGCGDGTGLVLKGRKPATAAIPTQVYDRLEEKRPADGRLRPR